MKSRQGREEDVFHLSIRIAPDNVAVYCVAGMEARAKRNTVLDCSPVLSFITETQPNINRKFDFLLFRLL